MLQSQIECHTLRYLSQPRPLRKSLMEKRDIHKELGSFYVTFLTFTLYIQWDQFIIVQVILPTPPNKVPSNLMLDSTRLHLNILNIVTLFTLKVVLGDQSTRLNKNLNYIQIETVKVNPHRDKNIFVPTIYAISKQISLSLLIRVLIMSLLSE